MRRVIAVLFVVSVGIVALAGCGTPKVASSPQNTTAPLDTKIAGSVPDRYTGQPLVIATDASLAPMEFVAGKRQSIVGADIDIVNALASTMGLKVIIRNVDFNKIVSGVNSGTYDLGVSSITDTRARETKVDFVTYFQAGSSFYVRRGAAKVVQPADLCGKRVAVQQGTILEALALKQKPLCDKAEPLSIVGFLQQTQATQAVISGKADVTLSDTPIASWAVRNSKGKLVLSGDPFSVAPYGIAVAKGSGLTEPLQKAVNKIIANGVYDNILLKWDLQAGSIGKSIINGAQK
jgi:polar amino acid transport system substrate-binding protein